MSKEVQKEPLLALDGGVDGLDFYKKILNQSIDYLKFGSYICMEIGYDQKQDVLKIIQVDTYSKKDLCGNDRIIVTKVGG